MLKDRRIRAAWVSIGCNLILVILKLTGARLSLSAAMKADALHSTSDILVSGLVLLSIWITLRGERSAGQVESVDKSSPDETAATSDGVTGENLTALLVALLLIGAAIGFLVGAVTGYTYPLERIPVAIAITWVCILISFFLGRYKVRIGREEGSLSLEADGHHSRMDMYSSIVVFVGLLGDLIGLRIDGLASAVVSVLVLKTGGEILYSSIRGLVASEVFTYRSWAALRDTALGQRAAPAYDRFLATRIARLHDRRVRVFRFAQDHRRALTGAVVMVAASVYGGSGLYRVQPDEVGVVLVCGRLVEPGAPPGLHYRFPWPLSTLHRVKPTAVRQLEFGYRTVARRGEVAEPSAYLWESAHRSGVYEKVEPEAVMLTGDVNELDLNFVIEYCVTDSGTAGFLFNVANAEALIRAASENTIRGVVGRMALTDILTTARQEIEREVVTGLQRLLDDYGAYVTVTRACLQDVHPPIDVVPAFRRVGTAREDRSTSINEAVGYKNWTIPRSHGFASQIMADAEAYSTEKKEEAEGNAAYFDQLYAAFEKAPGVMAFTMYVDRLEESLPALRKVILDKDVREGRPGNELQRFFMMGEFIRKGLDLTETIPAEPNLEGE